MYRPHNGSLIAVCWQLACSDEFCAWALNLTLTSVLKQELEQGVPVCLEIWKIEERTRGVVRVSELSVGDIIFGIAGPNRNPVWCNVSAVFPAAGGTNTTTHDGFTADHMVIDNTVHPYGKKGGVRVGPVYTLATDCNASLNAAGQAFTPISTVFCPHELSWSAYITLMSAIRRFANRTGYFWFDTSVYQDNDTAMVPHWLNQLHQICHQLLLCSCQDRCQVLENVMTEFVHEHLNKDGIVSNISIVCNVISVISVSSDSNDVIVSNVSIVH